MFCGGVVVLIVVYFILVGFNDGALGLVCILAVCCVFVSLLFGCGVFVVFGGLLFASALPVSFILCVWCFVLWVCVWVVYMFGACCFVCFTHCGVSLLHDCFCLLCVVPSIVSWRSCCGVV